MRFTWISLFCLALPLFAAPPILIAYDRAQSQAEMATRLLTTRWSIPRNLIDLKSLAWPCQVDHARVIQLCFNAAGEMILAKYDREIVDESFSIFFR